MRFLDRIPSLPLPGRWGLLSLQERPEAGFFAAAEVLSPGGSLREAAANLFNSIRKLDGMGLDGILSLSVPEQGLGRAINDRLRRAGGNHPGN
jgi:L-threonylcarbamoyladenylate synthase